MTAVRDTSAVLATYWQETGADRVASALPAACVSVVNASEVVCKFIDRGATIGQAREVSEGLGLYVLAFERDQAVSAATLRADTRHLGLSLGDRACLALALSRDVPVLPADRAWAGLDVGVEIEVVR